MSRYQFELAGPADDADLRHILANTPMAGTISVSFRREPNWFSGAVVDGRERQVVTCRDTQTGRVIGFGCRSLREVYLNGEPATIGYLSSLRVLVEHRNLGLVARGYAFFRRLHQDGKAPLYLTTIAEGNQTALKVLSSGRAGLPKYHPAGRYHTLALHLAPRGGAGPAIRPATTADLPALLDFLHATGSRRQFFPRYRLDDFLSETGQLRGLTLDWLLLAKRGGTIIGALAGWDQHDFRQSVVESYSGWLRWARPLYNVWCRLRGRSGLPAPGQSLRCLTVALPVVEGDDPEVFRALLTALGHRCVGGPWSHLLLGLHESDPLLPVARRLAVACYTTLLFLVCWEDGETTRASLDGRVPYLELGSL